MKPRKGVGPPALEIAYRITRRPRFSYQTYKTLVRLCAAWEGGTEREREGRRPQIATQSSSSSRLTTTDRRSCSRSSRTSCTTPRASPRASSRGAPPFFLPSPFCERARRTARRFPPAARARARAAAFVRSSRAQKASLSPLSRGHDARASRLYPPLPRPGAPRFVSTLPQLTKPNKTQPRQ